MSDVNMLRDSADLVAEAVEVLARGHEECGQPSNWRVPMIDELHGTAAYLREAAASVGAMRDAMTNFCERVEAGEVRSVKTYRQFCQLLGRGHSL